MSNQVMQFEKAIQILDWIASIDCFKCILIGGEPTIHPNVVEVFKYGVFRGIKMHIVSNGRCFSDNYFCDKMIEVGLNKSNITVSMHASSKENSEFLTGCNRYFDEFSKGIKNLIQRGITPTINIVMSKMQCGHFDKMIEWASISGINRLIFSSGLPIVSKNKVDATYILTPNDFGREVVRVFGLAKKCSIEAQFLIKYPLCILSRTFIDELRSVKAIICGCHLQSRSTILFDVKGGIVPCNHLLDFQIYNNIETELIAKTGQMKNLWESDIKMRTINDFACVYRSEYCKNCDLWNICAGGCPLLWSYYSPSTVINGWNY